jgi:hypothetical protein
MLEASYRVLERLQASEKYRRLSDKRKLEAIEQTVDVARQQAAKAVRSVLSSQLPITPAPPAGQLPFTVR